MFIIQMRVNSCFKHYMHLGLQCGAAKDAEDLCYRMKRIGSNSMNYSIFLSFSLFKPS